MAEQPLGITTQGDAQIMYTFVVDGTVRAADLGGGVSALTPSGEIENNVFIETTDTGPRGSVLEAVSSNQVGFWFTVESGGQAREFTSRNGHSSVGGNHRIEEHPDGTITVNTTITDGGTAWDVTGDVIAWDSHGSPAVLWNGSTVTDQPLPYVDTSVDPGEAGTRVSGKTGGSVGDGFYVDGTITSFTANLDQSQYTLTLGGQEITPGELPISTTTPDDGNGGDTGNGDGTNGGNGGNGDDTNGGDGTNGNGGGEGGIDGRALGIAALAVVAGTALGRRSKRGGGS